MKRLVAVTAVVIGLMGVAAFAQMGGGGGMQRESAGTPQTMSQDMVQNMTGVMTQMSEMLQKLSHPMGHMTVTEHARMQDLARIMREMSSTMTDLASHMDQGKVDKATAARMRDRMNAMNNSLKKLEQKAP